MYFQVVPNALTCTHVHNIIQFDEHAIPPRGGASRKWVWVCWGRHIKNNPSGKFVTSHVTTVESLSRGGANQS